jgi:hypothetical protein
MKIYLILIAFVLIGIHMHAQEVNDYRKFPVKY